ncbi:mechanosensitive ion channel family protein [Acanthopleuribacter pedis]|uniref:Mechanosensitive ion channel family protein n=1 Tax=Acanthopleuribacter pedis TaxID=442870 RepID=A0A8J7Q5P4_9BACT|nr:mechanosensitive ion channel family protein [Acanthopleuribacter pedis]MBO1317104.1 mechanosensitive ion channel family protein [Acanthopleuribacter pedis]
MYDFLTHWIHDHLGALGPGSQTLAGLLALLLLAIGIFTLSFLANLIAKRYILRVLGYIITRTKNKWDDVFLERKVFNRLSHLAPAIVIYISAAFVFPAHETHPMEMLMRRAAMVYMIVVSLLVLNSFFSAVADIYSNFDISRNRPIKGYIQALKIIIYLFAGILIISTIIDRSPLILLSGLGALTAILLLVFKDTILGFVAGIQLASNNMVRPGDWISMPKYGADGDVIDVTLTMVKVQNWDKTISYIPIYSLISDSFTNWRGMSESGGRRIKRALNIDMTTIRFMSDEDLAKMRKITLLKDYLAAKDKEIDDHHRTTQTDTSHPANVRRQTNIGIFRAYVEFYLRRHPKIHQEMTLIVRQLAPTSEGLPVEIYCFSNDQAWAAYEGIQGDIFDHLLAVVPLFELQVFQAPSGRDFKKLGVPELGASGS